MASIVLGNQSSFDGSTLTVWNFLRNLLCFHHNFCFRQGTELGNDLNYRLSKEEYTPLNCFPVFPSLAFFKESFLQT